MLFSYYDQFGQLTESVDADGKTSFNTYDPDGNVVATTDQTNQKTTDIADKDGNVTVSIDPNNSVSRTYYDGDGRVTEAIDGNVTESVDGGGHTHPARRLHRLPRHGLQEDCPAKSARPLRHCKPEHGRAVKHG
jgi:YD repeat-containing protein